VDAVLFDLFGTLVHNLPPERWRRAYGEMAAALDVDEEHFSHAWEHLFEARMIGAQRSPEDQLRAALAVFGAQASDAALAEAAQIKRTFFLEALQPKSDAVDCLAALRVRGIQLALVTDCAWDTPECLDETPLGEFFTVRASSAHLGVRKPDARMYEHALHGLNVDPRRCLYVGDGNSQELIGAKRHGMTTVWVDNGERQHHKDGWKPDGDFTVAELREILKLAIRA